MTHRLWRVGALTGLLVGVLVLAPTWGPGFLLRYDMVFVPRLQLGAQTLGVDGSFPRAVPNDALVVVLSQILPGSVVQALLLLAVFVMAGAGVGAVGSRLGLSRGGVIGATVVACWNPYVAERLSIGHWGFLLGYATLGWVAAFAYDTRHSRGRFLPLACALTAAGLSGSTGLIMAVLVLVCCASIRASLAGLGLAAGLGAPWWFPALFLTEVRAGDPAGVAAFAARADTPWGVVGSVVSGGGIWNSAAWFGERSSWLLSGAAFIASLGCVVAGLWLLPRWRRLALAGVIGLALALLPALPGGRELTELLVEHVPGGGLLRDSQKYLGTWMWGIAVGAGVLTSRLALSQRIPQPTSGMLALAASGWAVAVLPSLIWGHLGDWTSHRYPADFTRAASAIDVLPAGDAAVFPWTAFRRFEWNGNTVLLDPWPRLVQRVVLTNDDLPVDGKAVRGENRRSAVISTALESGKSVDAALDTAQVRYLIVLRQQSDAPIPTEMGTVVFENDSIEVVDRGPQRKTSQIRGADLTGWWFAGLAVVVAFVASWRAQKSATTIVRRS